MMLTEGTDIMYKYRLAWKAKTNLPIKKISQIRPLQEMERLLVGFIREGGIMKR